MRARAKGPPQSTTSFLDVLFCGLAGVIVMWVLVGRAEPVVLTSPGGFVRISQDGDWHLQGIHLTESGTGAHTFVPTGKVVDVKTWLADEVTGAFLTRCGLTFAFSKPKDGTIAGQMVLGWLSEDVEVDCQFWFSRCQAGSDLHTISVNLLTADLKELETFIFQDEEKLDVAWGKATIAARSSVMRVVEPATEHPAGAWCPNNRNKHDLIAVRIRIRGGHATYIGPKSSSWSAP